MERSRLGRIIAALTGSALAACGIWALWSIPRGPREFLYQNPTGGSSLWPLPFAPMNGFTPEQLSSHVARALLLFPACLLLGYAFQRVRLARGPKPQALIVVVIGTVLTATIAGFVIRGVPFTDDEATYLMQAELLSRGLFADPTFPRSEAFAEPFTIFNDAGMSGIYTFGTPMVLALGLPFGAPWLGQVALVALTLYCAFRAATQAGDRSVAWLGSLLLAVSPALTFTSAGFLSQVPALAGVSLAVLGLGTGGWRGGALMGTGLGFAFAARPQAAGPAGLALIALYGWKDRRLLAGMLLAGLPWALAVGFQDLSVTGSLWRLPRWEYTGEAEAYGFRIALRHYEHTPMKALALAGIAVVRLNGWALGWPMSLAGPALWFILRRPHRAIVGPWGAIAVAAFLFQAGYASIGVSETGAIYHYAALPFFAFSTAAALRAAAAHRWGAWAQAAAAASLVLGTTTFYVEHVARVSRLSATIEGPRRSLDLERPALVFEEVWQARPQTGWVFGIPFRERDPASPIVRFPRPTRASRLEYLTARWPDRHCGYLWYDWRDAEYRLSPCGEIGTHDLEIERGRADAVLRLERRADGRPWYEDGGWKEAFPYLPGRANAR